MELTIVRHGQTIENLGEITSGHLDGSLSEEGKKQAEKLGQRFKNHKFDHFYCSDLGRTKETLLQITKFHLKTPITFTRALRERGKGIFDGKPRSDYYKVFDLSGKIIAHYKPEKGESLIAVRNRAVAFYRELLEKHPNDSILICTHGGWISMLLSYLLSIPINKKLFNILTSNSSVTIIETTEDKAKIKLLNCTKHLDETKN